MPTFPTAPLWGFWWFFAVVAAVIAIGRELARPALRGLSGRGFSVPRFSAPGLSPRPQTDALTGHGYRLAPSLLTPTEALFYAKLREAVGPMAVIQCKVRLADVLLAPERDKAALWRVTNKHVDFLLCAPGSLRPLLAVELDDQSHDRPDRQARDAFVDGAYQGAGLAVLHVPAQQNYDPALLLSAMHSHLSP